MFTTSIVIPTYNTWDLTGNLIRELEQHERNNIDHVLIVDDGSTSRESESLFFSSFPVDVERLKENVGFTLACNHGLKLASKPPASKHLIFLISNDVQIRGRFIEHAADILFGARRAFVGQSLLSHDTGWNRFNGITYSYLEGYFLACTSDGWRDIGYFDINYAPFDYEDVDISQVAKKRGYKLVPLNSPHIFHKGGGTLGYTEERRKITERNRDYFRRKWAI